MLTQPEEVVISVSDCRAVICRYRQLDDGSRICECATNAEELEAAAIEAIVAAGTPFTLGQQYPCPSELADQAHWS